jgi:hypothetical protein
MNTITIGAIKNIAGKSYKVYNILPEYKGGLVCFGRCNGNGEMLSAMNPHNILSLTFAQVEKFTKLGSIK